MALAKKIIWTLRSYRNILCLCFPIEYEAIRIILAMSAKLFVSSGFAIIYLLGAELYPTELRTTGLAVGIFCGRIGAITAPYIVDLMVKQ